MQMTLPLARRRVPGVLPFHQVLDGWPESVVNTPSGKNGPQPPPPTRRGLRFHLTTPAQTDQRGD